MMNPIFTRWYCEPCFGAKDQLIDMCNQLSNNQKGYGYVNLEYNFNYFNQNTKKKFSISIFQIITYPNIDHNSLLKQLQYQLKTINKRNILISIKNNELSFKKNIFFSRSLIPLRICSSIPREIGDRYIFTFCNEWERLMILKNFEYYVQKTPFTHFITIPIAPNFPDWVDAMQNISNRWGIQQQVKINLSHITIALFVIENNDDLSIVNKIILDTIKQITWPEDNTIKYTKVGYFGSPQNLTSLFFELEKNSFIQCLSQFIYLLISKLQDSGFGYFNEDSQLFHITFLKRNLNQKNSALNLESFIKDFNNKELPVLHIRELRLVQRNYFDDSGFYKTLFHYNICDNNSNNIKVEHAPANNKFIISKPIKSKLNITPSKTPHQEIKIETVIGRTFDSSPFFILKINSFSFYFNVPEMSQRYLMVKYNDAYPSPQNIFITSLFPDSVGGLSHFFLQNYHKFSNFTSVTGPKDLIKVILLDYDYFGNKKIPDPSKLQISDNFDNRLIHVESITLSQSISYDILLKTINQRFLVVDCRFIDDLKKLPNLKEYSVILHLTTPEILIQKEYTSFFTSANESDEMNTKKDILNICFMPSGIISNHKSEQYYSRRANSILPPLSFGKTLKPPPGFINFTAAESEYDFISKKMSIKGQGEEIDIDTINLINTENNDTNESDNNKQNISENSSNNNEGNNTNNENNEKLVNLSKLNILSKLTEFEPSLPDFKRYAVTFLGSGTKFVSQTVNLSGYLIHTKYGFVIFDPSEGFLDQLIRKFGPKLTEFILKNIECIWISHFHQDHILGIPSLLYERSKLTNKQIYFFAPQKLINDIQVISRYYGDFHVIYHNRESSNLIKSDTLAQNSNNDDSESYYDKFKFDSKKDYLKEYKSTPDTFKINDHLTIQSIDVCHCNFSKGCLLLIDDIKEIAFSGDHGYKKDHFAQSFQNCDFLIHEATFHSILKERIGQIFNHCYIDEAIDTAIYMNARMTCLTHFSQRYKPEYLEYRESDNIMLAFDFLEVTSENGLDVFKQCSTIRIHK